jgi:riboflavin synthase
MSSASAPICASWPDFDGRRLNFLPGADLMFTGIVAAVGRIERVESLGQGAGLRLHVDAGGLDLSDVVIGDSIAIQGACMTAVALDGQRFSVEVSLESLDKTIGLGAPGEVNLEKALRLADRLGGHLVSGHVDGLGEVVAFEPVGESWRLDIRLPAMLSKYLAYKGSVTVNGTSLTVNTVKDLTDGGCEISINLIPHTLQSTTLKHLRAGSRVNLEIDLIARYVERMLSLPVSLPSHPNS